MNEFMRRLSVLGWSLLVLFMSAALADEETNGSWPREISVSEGVVVIYQPQPESVNGNLLQAHSAVAVEMKGAKEAVYGAIWFEARLDTDRDAGLAYITDVSVTRMRFPTEDQKKSKQFIALLEREMPKWQFPISMERLMSTLELEDRRSDIAESISTKAPKIIFVNEPAVLISIDGEPRMKEVPNSKLMRVNNTPYTILFDTSSKTYYLNADAKTWYAANDIKGDWSVAKSVPNEVAALAPKHEEDEQPDESRKPGPIPKIIVETVPAELISATGDPEFTPISGTDLLYVSNTESDILKDINSQNYYVLLSGRWYAGANLSGPWKYMPGKELPKDFSNIPEDSEMGTVLYAVPGTDVANEAVLDAQIPQTAMIDRKLATLSVDYDGNPKFEKIKSTSLTYAVNTATPVIKVDTMYYACNEAVWFVSESPKGSWRVAVSVPDVIYTIPPDSPIYHVTFVRIYKVTDEVVYVGYTPGYTGTYIYHTTIVYGTGYYWPGWYGYYYYPRRSTWGYHVRWNPRAGFRFGLSYSSGPFTFYIGGGRWYRGGWWGPGRYRGYHRGYRHGSRAGYRAGYRAGVRNATKSNIYNNKSNTNRLSTQSKNAGKQVKGSAASKRANNVYADRNGNIYRKSDKGWEQNTKSGWSSEKGASHSGSTKAKPAAKPTVNPNAGKQKPSTAGASRSLERSSSARQRGAQRNSRSSGGMGRGGGRR